MAEQLPVGPEVGKNIASFDFVCFVMVLLFAALLRFVGAVPPPTAAPWRRVVSAMQKFLAAGEIHFACFDLFPQPRQRRDGYCYRYRWPDPVDGDGAVFSELKRPFPAVESSAPEFYRISIRPLFPPRTRPSRF